MQNYTIFAGAILFPLSGILFFAIPTIYLIKTGKINQYNSTNIVSRKDLFIIALFDSLRSIIQSIPTPYLTIISMNIFNKLSLIGIPIASYFFLNTRYLPNHFLGIFLTMYGITITFIPNFIQHQSIGNGWLALYILGIIPDVCSFIYKEKKLKQRPNIWWFNTWVCIYQLFIGILLLPLNILIFSVRDFPKQIGYGFMCQFVGKNMQEGDDCKYAFLWLIIFSILSTIMNTIMLMIIRDGSSVLFVIINTLKTPITSYLGSFKVLAGKNVSKINITDIFSFIILLVGSIVYNWKNEIKENDDIINNLRNDLSEFEYQESEKELLIKYKYII